MKVSIILPTYNRANIIVSTIQSILTRSFQDFEIIVSDDASTDKTDEKIKEINDKRIKYYKNKKNLWYGPNLRSAYEKADGEIIFLMRDDDVLLPIVHSNNASVKIMYMNPTKFVVLAKSDSSFVIILNQQYSDLWTASVNGKPVPLYDHIRVNTQINGLYFNCWLINSTGTSKIILYYKPQTQNLILLTFSGTFDLAILIGYVYLFLKERIKK